MYYVLSYVLFRSYLKNHYVTSYPGKKDQDYGKDLEEQGAAAV